VPRVSSLQQAMSGSSPRGDPHQTRTRAGPPVPSTSPPRPLYSLHISPLVPSTTTVPPLILRKKRPASRRPTARPAVQGGSPEPVAGLNWANSTFHPVTSSPDFGGLLQSCTLCMPLHVSAQLEFRPARRPTLHAPRGSASGRPPTPTHRSQLVMPKASLLVAMSMPLTVPVWCVAPLST
jgi:hypothetical protein